LKNQENLPQYASLQFADNDIRAIKSIIFDTIREMEIIQSQIRKLDEKFKPLDKKRSELIAKLFESEKIREDLLKKDE